FPAPAAFCTAGAAERLGELGVIRQRARSICAVAEKLEAGALELRPGADVEANAEALLDVPGIGPWTVQYALMRAFAYPDAFPAADYAVKHAFPGLAPREIEALSRAWSPLRSYAVMSLWSEPLG
ncbi:DNA-3-methyladenine glycosylase family protein, partial [Eggerthella sinensis]